MSQPNQQRWFGSDDSFTLPSYSAHKGENPNQLPLNDTFLGNPGGSEFCLAVWLHTAICRERLPSRPPQGSPSPSQLAPPCQEGPDAQPGSGPRGRCAPPAEGTWHSEQNHGESRARTLASPAAPSVAVCPWVGGHCPLGLFDVRCGYLLPAAPICI